MVDECQVSLTGYVATQPVERRFDSGANNVKMRVAWTERRRDRVTGEWMDGNTSYVSVYCWRRLATNVAVSLRTGDRVVVKGKLLVRTYEDKEGNRRSAVDVEATSIGHDMTFGVSRYLRVRPDTGMTAAEYDAAIASGQIVPTPRNGFGHGAGDGRPELGNGAGEGLRFAGGLESANEVSAMRDGHVLDGDPDTWSDEADDADIDSEVADAAEGTDADAESGAEREGEEAGAAR